MPLLFAGATTNPPAVSDLAPLKNAGHGERTVFIIDTG